MRLGAPRIAVVVGRFHEPVAKGLLAGALARLGKAGIPKGAVEVRWVPGAFEIPQAAGWLLARRRERPEAVIALGAVVKGETRHDEHLGRAVTERLLALAVKSGVPVGLGVVTTLDARQALARAGGSRGNRGADAAEAVLEMLRLKKAIA